MKRALVLTLFLAFSHTADAQVLIALILGDELNTGKIEFGLAGGANLATVDGISQAQNKALFNLGFYFDIKLKDPSWMIHTGVIVKSTMGAENVPVYSLNDPDLDSLFSSGSITRKLSYFNVPIMLKYRGKNHIYAEGGVQLGLMYNASDEFITEVKGEDELTYTLQNRDDYHPLDAGLVAGIGYRLLGGNGMNLGVRYYYGLVDMVVDDSSPNQYNRSIYFELGIPIGATKNPKKS
jgi:hypothetical protein